MMFGLKENLAEELSGCNVESVQIFLTMCFTACSVHCCVHIIIYVCFIVCSVHCCVYKVLCASLLVLSTIVCIFSVPVLAIGHLMPVQFGSPVNPFSGLLLL